MTFKEKILGFILIIIGALPFLSKIQAVSNLLSKYKIVSYLAPGNIIYQTILILIGLLLIISRKKYNYKYYK